MNFPTELRQAAVRCKNAKLASGLRILAKEIEDAALKLRLNTTTDNMVTLNGVWAQGHRAKLEADKDASLWGEKPPPDAA